MIIVIKTIIMVSIIMGSMGCIYAIKKADKGDISLGYVIGAILGIMAWPVVLVGIAIDNELKERKA